MTGHVLKHMLSVGLVLTMLDSPSEVDRRHHRCHRVSPVPGIVLGGRRLLSSAEVTRGANHRAGAELLCEALGFLFFPLGRLSDDLEFGLGLWRLLGLNPKADHRKNDQP